MSSIGFDFDGVIHSYEKGWDDGTIYGTPIDGIFELIRDVQDHHAVFIHTVRDPVQVADWMCRQDKDIRCVTEDLSYGHITTWQLDIERCAAVNKPPTVLGFNEVQRSIKFWNDHEKIFVTNRKLPAVAYIDDRAVRFFNTKQTRNELVDRSIIPFRPKDNT